jgi:hypothetical protein
MGNRGQVFPLIAIAVLVLVGVVGFAVDAGYHQYRQRVQQTATDSAALAGGFEYYVGDWAAAAKQDAATNGFKDTTSGTCPAQPTVGTVCVHVAAPPDAPDAFSGTSGAVEVEITSYNPTFFESVFQIYNVPITTKAVAVQKTETSDNCVLVLNGNANFNQGGSTPAPGASPGVDAPNCGLAFNQAVNFHGAVVDAASINCAQLSQCGNAYSYVQATPAASAPVTDPCPWISYCAHLASTTPPCSGTPPAPTTDSTTGITTVYPGCYKNGLSLKNYSNVQFQCGFYLVQGVMDASATGKNSIPINISQSCALGGAQGVTFYVTGGGQINFRNDVINLSAPTNGDYTEYTAGEQNVLIYQSPSDTSTVNMQSAIANCGLASCNSYFSGMIYAPDATLNYNQFNSTSTGSSGDVLIIAGTLNANGGMTGVLSAPGPSGSYTITVPVLGE